MLSAVTRCQRRAMYERAGSRTPAIYPAASATEADCWSPKAPKRLQLARLTEQIRHLCARGSGSLPRCPSELAALDTALGGGFSRGAVHELLAAQEGAAVRSLALMVATHAAGRHKWILYIDTSQDFYPPGAAQLGVPLERLIVIRAPRRTDALWACEQTLRCRSVAAVVLPLRSLDTYASRRLQLAAETGQNLGLLVLVDSYIHRDARRGDQAGPERSGRIAGPSFAASRLWFDPLLGEAGVRRMCVTVLKPRAGQAQQPFVLELGPELGAPPAPTSAPAQRQRDGVQSLRRMLP